LGYTTTNHIIKGDTMSEESVVSINGTELKESSMTNEQKYFARQVQDLTNKKSRIEFELDQILASLKVFQNALVDTTKEIANEILETKKKESK
tara:strand:- start:3023 stop:3301 length:279 start_codon:yes stop_codon:yes gene_type:complete